MAGIHISYSKKALYKRIKRTADVFGALSLLAVSSPLLMATVLAIKTESNGPLLFSHKRVGLNGKDINIYKFRSMREGSENLEASLNDEELEEYYKEFKLHNDPRITESGRFLRKTSLDELPQLINVLKGDMSLVGPRPVTEAELAYYSEKEKMKLLSSKPGITGLWQISDRKKTTYQSGKRQKTELFYTVHESLLMDTAILMLTPAAILRRTLS